MILWRDRKYRGHAKFFIYIFIKGSGLFEHIIISIHSPSRRAYYDQIL